MILVPVRTPEASAISNAPELRHTGEGKWAAHITGDKSYTAPGRGTLHMYDVGVHTYPSESHW